MEPPAHRNHPPAVNPVPRCRLIILQSRQLRTPAIQYQMMNQAMSQPMSLRMRIAKMTVSSLGGAGSFLHAGVKLADFAVHVRLIAPASRQVYSCGILNVAGATERVMQPTPTTQPCCLRIPDSQGGPNQLPLQTTQLSTGQKQVAWKFRGGARQFRRELGLKSVQLALPPTTTIQTRTRPWS